MKLVRLGRGTIVASSITAAALAVTPVGGLAFADTDPPSGTPATVSADALPTWQVDGVVWHMTTVGSTVYAVGKFTKARPPGVAAGGAGEVTRNNILAFDLNTGNLITSFDHSLNGQALRVVASPDGSKIYVGGDFTTVDGQPRTRVAAFDTATGALDPGFKPTVSSRVRGIAVTGSTVYLGGAFFAVNGTARTRLAAVSRGNGALLPWRPTADDNEVMALVMSPSGKRVIVGGRFQQLNGAAKVGIGAVDATSGASVAWTSRPIPSKGLNREAWVTDLYSDGTTVYGSSNGEGWHVFDGRFAADPENGDLVWLDNCYGATYGVWARNKTLYSVSHAHDCTSLGAFPESTPERWQRGLAETTYATGKDKGLPGYGSNYAQQPVPTLLHWFPWIALGSYTGQYQGAWAVTGNAQFVAMGGEFPKVNDKPQQGLVRFRLREGAPNKVGPVYDAATLKPTVRQLFGSLRVNWKSTWDFDNNNLKYEVLRDAETTPVYTSTVASAFWNLPNQLFVDKGLPKGSTHTYKIRVIDPLGNKILSPPSAPVTIP